MKLLIEGEELTKKDLVEIGKFLTKFFENRTDLIKVFISEGTEDLSKEECAELLVSMFEDRECYTKVFHLRDKEKK